MSGVDVLTARVAFRDRSAIDVLDLALRFIVVHGRAYAIVTVWIALPAALAAIAAADAWGWTTAWLVAIPLWLAAQVPFTLLASRLVFERNVRARTVIRASLREIPRILVMRVLWGAIVAVGAIFFVVPALWALGAFHFMPEVMLLERASVGQAFARAQRVAAASIGESLVAYLFGALVVAASIALAELGGRTVIADLLQFRAPPAAWTEGGSVLAMVGLFASLPFTATARFFTYLNVRTRVEGWDIQTRFAALAARAGELEAER